MTRVIEISLSENYCPTWKTWEGVRDLVQNWMDERDSGKPATLEHGTSTECLVLWNEGARFEREQMALFGATTKFEGERGKFGEGFKIGVLALVRAGHTVTVDTHHGTYVAEIRQSEQYQARVLTFIQTSETPHDGVRVTIHHISEYKWNEMKDRFLWDSPRDSILFDRPGAVYVKDIWVGNYDYRYGYNLNDVEIDRDRKLIDPWNLKWAIAGILNEALKLGLITPAAALGMVEDKTSDAASFPSRVTSTTRVMLVTAFKEKYGENAIAVSTLDDVKEAEHSALRPVVANTEVCGLLADSNRQTYSRNSITSTFTLDELSGDERASLRWAIDLIKGANVKIEAAVDVCNFLETSTLGRREGGNIYVARKVLDDRTATLQVLVEEIAHRKGPDGSHAHKIEIHAIYAKIVNSLVQLPKEQT